MASLALYDTQAHLLRNVPGNEVVPLLQSINVDCASYPTRPLAPDADVPEVLRVYADLIAQLQERSGYKSFDAVRMRQDAVDPEQRAKFLAEHTHADDEVRFFVEGGGLFCLHVDDTVYAVTCSAGDFLRVPAGIKHWFDTGLKPNFTALRLFIAPDGWVPTYTGATYGNNFPAYN